MTTIQRMHELILCPLQRCYPASKPAGPRREWNGGGRFLTRKETAQLSVLDAEGRERLIAQIVAKMRARA